MLFILCSSMALADGSDDSLINDPARPYQISFHAEVGALAVLAHAYQSGAEGTRFDFIEDGGQDTLFPVVRLSSETTLNDRHTLGLLYQPLVLSTDEVTTRDLNVDGTVFPVGTPVDFLYSFSFWRGSYLYDFAADPDTELALGGSMQIRNARITVSDKVGGLYATETDIGPVPLIKLRARHVTPTGWFYGAEVDGLWAPIKYLNGSGTDVEGALLDASLRGGMQLDSGAEAFVNLRYLGGGAEGTGKTDVYVENWLSFVTLSVGLSLR